MGVGDRPCLKLYFSRMAWKKRGKDFAVSWELCIFAEKF
jgi:hypothetical protein